MVFFFFQAEDGIRDRNVTGVQTCALPIFPQGRVPHPDYTALGFLKTPTTEEQYERGPLPKKAPPSTNSSTSNGCGHKSACVEDRKPYSHRIYVHPPVFPAKNS